MSEKLIKAFESQKTNPFQLKNVILCHTLIELSQIPSPKVRFINQFLFISKYLKIYFLKYPLMSNVGSCYEHS